MQTRVLGWLGLVAGVIGLGLMVVLAQTGNVVLGVFAFVLWQGGYWTYARVSRKRAHARMVRLWTLADALGVDEAKLQAWSGQYGKLDWAASRPAVMQFLPRRSVADALIRRLEQEQAVQAVKKRRGCRSPMPNGS